MLKEILETMNERRGGTIIVTLTEDGCRQEVSLDLENIFDNNDIDYEFERGNEDQIIINVSKIDDNLERALNQYSNDCVDAISFE